jgi:hypothetical protein
VRNKSSFEVTECSLGSAVHSASRSRCGRTNFDKERAADEREAAKEPWR